MKVNFQALGCRLNEAELETWSNQFQQMGFGVTTDSHDADLIVFNSCSVTAEADRKSRQRIKRIHKNSPDARLVVTGCYATLNLETVENYLGADLVLGNSEKDNLVKRSIEQFNFPTQPDTGTGKTSLFLRGRHRAFIKVQDGCRYRCTFCIVTIARGVEISRPIQQIVDEINLLYHQGVQEVAITGVHVGGYGSDINSNLYELLTEILNKTSIPRIRLASVEPWDLPDHFFQLFSDNRLMPHMHLPLQSGSDSVLRRMARRCKTLEFSQLVDKARKAVPHFNITTDIIVGFPGETEKEWRQSLDFVESTGFGHMHIFSYSKRDGTKAAGLPDQIAKSLKKERSAEMHELAKKLKRQSLQQHIGQHYEILWEQKLNQESGLWSGYTPHYHRILSNNTLIKPASLATARVDKLSDDGMSLLENSTVRPVNFKH